MYAVESPTMPDMRPIGLIAGEGRLPVLVAHGARAAGRDVVGLSIGGIHEPEVQALCVRFETAPLLRLGSWARRLRRMGAAEAVMVGRVNKASTMHGGSRLMQIIRGAPDVTTALVWYRRLRHDRRSPAILAAVADTLARGGVPLIDSTTFIPDHLATPGVMTRRAPSHSLRADVEFGWPVLASVLRLDIGQAIAVRERDVIAVEAVEGTDRMIERAGRLCPKGGWTLLKGCRPDHDRRADVPTIGEATVRRAHAAGCVCIALGAGDVILLDKPAVLRAADELEIPIVGVGREHPGP